MQHTLAASTLAETLVMMVVAGIIFLSVMDGLRLYNRLLLRQTVALHQSGRTTDGYYRVETLVSAADSIGVGPEGVQLFRRGGVASLFLRDSGLIYRAGEFCDTLLHPVGMLRLIQGDGNFPDTLTIGLHPPSGVLMLKFTVSRPPETQYREAVGLIENEYGYEE